MLSADEKNKYKLLQVEQDFFRDAIKYSMAGDAEKLDNLVVDFIKVKKITAQELFQGFQSEGRTLVHLAANSGHARILNVIFKHCTDKNFFVNLADSRGFTPLINATISESDEMMSTFLSLGANVNARTSDGSAAVHFAAGDGNVARLELLLKAGANLNVSSKLGGSPLHWAAGKGRAAAIEFLVKRGIDVNALSADGLPPVIMACVAACDGGVKSLVDAGADCGHIMSGNLTALHICSEHGLLSAVTSILNTPTGLNCVNMETDDGNKPIHLAAMYSHMEVIDLLLPHTTDVSQNVDELIEQGRERLKKWELLHAPAPPTNSASTASTNAAVAESSNNSSCRFPEPSPEDHEKAEKFKDIGNSLYKANKFPEALIAYSNAININEYNPTYYSNRSAGHLANKDPASALRDSELCIRLKPDWAKAYYRKGAALLALNRFEDSACAAFEGCKLDDKSEELKALLKKAVKKGQEEHKQKMTEALQSNK